MPIPENLEKIIIGSSVRFVVAKTVAPSLRTVDFLWGVVKSIENKSLRVSVDSQPKHYFHELRRGSELTISEQQVVDVVN